MGVKEDKPNTPKKPFIYYYDGSADGVEPVSDADVPFKSGDRGSVQHVSGYGRSGSRYFCGTK